MMLTSVLFFFFLTVSEPDSYFMPVDLSSILSAVSSKLQAWSSHVMWLFIFQMEDPSQQARSHTQGMHASTDAVDMCTYTHEKAHKMRTTLSLWSHSSALSDKFRVDELYSSFLCPLVPQNSSASSSLSLLSPMAFQRKKKKKIYWLPHGNWQ